ncbi:unnamed protein product [Rhodiola kirilowii]
MEDKTRAALLSKLKPEDHIASERLGDQFEHHELYKGAELFCHMNISSKDKKNKDVDTHILLSKYLSCRMPEQVLEAAQSNHYMGKYSFLFNNCEDFAVDCMVGKERSIQAENKLHKVPYKVGKMFHLLTDGHKMKEKIKDKALRFFAHPSPS